MQNNQFRVSIPLRRLAWLCAAWIVLLGYSNLAAAQKTDLIYLTNGDRITGEIKSLDRGQLLVKTNSLGTLYVEWTAIDHVVSDKTMQLELVNGRRIESSLDDGESGRTLTAVTGESKQEIPIQQVVRIDQLRIDRTFWQRLEGKVGAGLSYTKGSEVGQLYFLGNTRYRKVRSEYVLDWNSILTERPGSNSQRGNIDLVYRRFRENRWFWMALGGLDKNEELGIDLRTTGGGGVGRFLKKTNDLQISLTGGVVATAENTIVGAENATNLDGLIAADLSFFRFTTPKTNIRTSLRVWPSITDSGRVRANWDATVAQEVFTSDFSLDLTVYATYDSSPPIGAAGEDYGIVTSLNYTY
ncbi:MAG: DUF481 domain-containing protein [Gammaproteobacteria bacterium]|nr:DUF481 domain-containing protein [Gammaproteobacteria bacterium]